MEIHLGIDFDNTIVTYDRVFHKYAVKLALISQQVRESKKEVRDIIRMLPEGNNRWTELQGVVYGYHMDEANPAEGAEQFLQACREKAIRVSIISHKTIYPALGPHIDLRQAAKQWLEDKGFFSKLGLRPEDIIFVGTLDEKLAQITEKRCTHFIDDLVEVLLHPDFPTHVEKILYSPREETHIVSDEIRQFETWNEIRNYFFESKK